MHKQYIKISIGLLIGGMILLIMIGASIAKTAHGAFIEPIDSQTSYATTSSYLWTWSGGNALWIQGLGNTNGGFLTGITMKAHLESQNVFNSTGTINMISIDASHGADVALYNSQSANNSAYTTEIQEAQIEVVFLGFTDTDVTLATTTDLQLDTGRLYFLQFQPAGTTREMRLFGSDTASYAGGDINGNETNLTVPYMIFSGWGLENFGSGDVIKEPITPLNGATTTVNTTFTFTYNTTNTTSTYAGIEIRNIQTQTSETMRLPITTYGSDVTFSVSKTLTDNNYYQWSAFLSSDTEKTYTTQIRGLHVGTEQTWDGNLAGLIVSTTTAQTAGFGVVDLLQTTIPFSYIYQINTIIQAISTTPTGSFPTITISTGASSSIPISATLFSASSTSTYLSDTNRLMFRTLIEIMLWISLMSMVFFTIKKQF